MRIFRQKPFYWGTKEVTRYLRYKYSGHDLVLRLTVYNTICEIESDFNGQPVTSFAKVISNYSGIKRQNINEIIKEFQDIGIIITYQKKIKDGKFGSKYLVLEDKAPNVPNRDNGKNSTKLPLFGNNKDEKGLTDVPITDIGKRDIIKKIDDIEIKSSLAAKPLLNKTKSPHAQLIELFHDICLKARGIKPVITGADAKNLKRILDSGITLNQLEQITIYFLGSFRYKQFAPSISTMLSAGIINGLMNKAKNGEEFWKEMDGLTQRYGRGPAQGNRFELAKNLESLKSQLSNKMAIH